MDGKSIVNIETKKLQEAITRHDFEIGIDRSWMRGCLVVDLTKEDALVSRIGFWKSCGPLVGFFEICL